LDFNQRYLFDQSHGALSGGVVGLDEVGRGPLAGPVVAAAVLLDPKNPIAGLNDSKKLSAANRRKLCQQIHLQAKEVRICAESVAVIEQINILQASLRAMTRALQAISTAYASILIDGNQPLPAVEKRRQKCIVKGDQLSASIAAASIVAKCYRDEYMEKLDKEFPVYGFARHKGYGTAAHRIAIGAYGMCREHRPGFCRSIFSVDAQTLNLFEVA